MTPAQLETVIARTGHRRYRALTADSNSDVVQRDAYRELVRRLAGSSSVVMPTASESLSLLKQARKCPHRTAPSCSCAFAKCGKIVKDVSAQTCMTCVQAGEHGAGGGDFRDRPPCSSLDEAAVGVNAHDRTT